VTPENAVAFFNLVLEIQMTAHENRDLLAFLGQL
jgi:hypothetical protein